jgi:hypothetical protein
MIVESTALGMERWPQDSARWTRAGMSQRDIRYHGTVVRNPRYTVYDSGGILYFPAVMA